MSDLDTLAEIVSDAAIKAAKDVSVPLDDKIKSIGRSIKSVDRLAREALGSVDLTKKGLVEEQQMRDSDVSKLRDEVYRYTEAFTGAIKGLRVSQHKISDQLKQLPEDAGSEIDDDLGDLRKEFADHRVSVARAIEAVSDAQDRLDEISRQVPEPITSEIESLRQSQDENLSGVVEDFRTLKEQYDTEFKKIDDLQADIISRGDEAFNRIDELTEEFKVALEKGVKGDPGEPGDNGSPGARGPKGEPGSMNASERWTKDLLYKAGQTVLHRGGTWYSEITTVDEPGESPGWTCIANGIDVGECYIEDGTLVQVFADGQRLEARVMPRILGLYKETERYQKGDYVTWNGSLYRALVDGPEQHPGKKIPEGDDSQWACDVKRGSRGSRGPAGDPADAAAMVHAEFQKDYQEATVEIEEYLEGLSL